MTIKNFVYVAIGSALGLGLSPIGPGTFGTILGVFIHVSIVYIFPIYIQFSMLIIMFVLVCIANNLLTPWAESYWKCKDPGHFVLDEVAGYLLVPILFRHGQLWQVVLWGFLLFRIIDIIKIPPARQIDQNWHGAWGILLDDLVSAGYAVLIMYLMMWVGQIFGIENWLISNY